MMDLVRHLPERCYSRSKIPSVDGAVVHFISAKNVLPDDPFNRDAIIGIFEDHKLSAHYLIERDGTLIELVPDLHKAYHAGYSRMNGRDSCNTFTIGYELVGGTDWAYTDEQIITLGTSLAKQMTSHRFTSEWVQGHDKIRADWIARYPDRAKAKNVPKKYDPGEHFPWEILYDMIAGVSAAVERS
jgi:N-acetyl-anhydromuramyl-L-alanine amidase AmpD